MKQQTAKYHHLSRFFCLMVLCGGVCASFAAPAERIVRFPDRESQNTLFYVDPQAEQKWWWPMNLPLDASAAAARGTVALDAHRPLGLIFKADGTDDPLTVLDALAPGDLHTLIIHGKVNRGDSQVIVDTNIDACIRLSGLKCLILNHAIVSERALAKLPAMKHLEKLCVITETLDDDGVRHIARIPALKELRLYGTIGNRSMETLSTMDTLEALFINGRKLSDVGLGHLSAMSRLRELVLSKANYTEQGLRHLATVPALQKLVLLGFEVGPEGAAHIAAIPNLRSLGLNRAISDAAVAQLARSLSLEDLTLSMRFQQSGDDLTDAGLQGLCQLRTLQSLSLNYGRFTDDGLMHLAALPCLQHLMMPNTRISENTFEHLKNTLPYLQDARFRSFVFDRDQPGLTWKEYMRARSSDLNSTDEIIRDIIGSDMEDVRNVKYDSYFNWGQRTFIEFEVRKEDVIRFLKNTNLPNYSELQHANSQQGSGRMEYLQLQGKLYQEQRGEKADWWEIVFTDKTLCGQKSCIQYDDEKSGVSTSVNVICINEINDGWLKVNLIHKTEFD